MRIIIVFILTAFVTHSQVEFKPLLGFRIGTFYPQGKYRYFYPELEIGFQIDKRFKIQLNAGYNFGYNFITHENIPDSEQIYFNTIGISSEFLFLPNKSVQPLVAFSFGTGFNEKNIGMALGDNARPFNYATEDIVWDLRGYYNGIGILGQLCTGVMYSPSKKISLSFLAGFRAVRIHITPSEHFASTRGSQISPSFVFRSDFSISFKKK